MTLDDFHRIEDEAARSNEPLRRLLTEHADTQPPYDVEELRRQYPVTGHPRRSRTSFKDLTGQTFGRWSVLAEAPKTCPGQSKWQCRCSCGAVKLAVCYTSLTTGRSKSCGCLKRELSAKLPHERHGHANPTYRSWHARRSLMPLEWRDNFDQFLKDMGPRPDGARLVSRDGRRWGKETCEWRVKA